MSFALKNQTAIVGAGSTDFGHQPDVPVAELAAIAIREALDDAGLQREDLDGLILNIGRPLGEDYDRLSELLNLRLRYVEQTWTHGRFMSTCVQHAAMTVHAGLADVVACLCGIKFSSLEQMGGQEDLEGYRPGGGPHGEHPHFGMTSPAAGAAMSLQRYMHRYGATSHQLAAIPVTFRQYASQNPRAHMKAPISVQDHQDSRWIVEPLHLYDCSPMSDGGVCLLITTAERASDTRSRPVYLQGMQGLQAGREEFIFARPGMGMLTQSNFEFEPTAWDRAVYERADVDREDIDGFYTYDAFSPLVWFALERFGFCEPGQACRWATVERMSRHGGLPVNTNGGLLSEGHISGWNHMIEMVRQLRGTAGARQISNARLLQWGTCFGDSLILSGSP